jgi:hypothetical protein
MKAAGSQRLLLPLTAAALALLVWLPLGLVGVPLDTPDGFLHLGWAVGWARQVAGGWWWPQWSDLNWAGAGTFALAIYPPLFRHLVGVPLLAGVPADQALAGALLVVLLLNAAGALALAQLWLRPGGWRWLLLLTATLNPYLLMNVYVRGAWPEALAQGWLWWLAVALLGVRNRKPWGVPLAALAIAGVVWSNWNSTVLLLILWGLAGAGLAAQRAWAALGLWLAALFLGLGVSAPFWLPALQLLPLVRPPIPSGLLLWEFFGAGAAGESSFGRLLWIQALVLVLLLLVRWLGWGRRSCGLGSGGLVLAALALLMMLPISQPIYGLVAPLQRIQFPWRWLGPGWFGALLWLCSPGALPAAAGVAGGWRRISLVLAGLAALGGWFDSLWRFRTNLMGHAPTGSERLALRQLLACDPLLPCPRGIEALPATGELAKRFAALPDGRIALAGVPDYTPAGIPERSWHRRLQTFWLPAWPQTSWASFTGQGRVWLVDRSPQHRTLRIEARSAGGLRLMQWASPLWQVRLRPGAAASWGQPLASGAADAAGWVQVPLQPGSWMVELRYGR